MFGDLSTFSWSVPHFPNAFRFEECVLSEERPYAKELSLTWRDSEPTRQYSPFSGTESKESLYRTLASVPPTPEGILDFVRRYGRLGEGVERYARLPDGSLRMVEPLREWCQAVVRLGEAVRLWDLAQQGNRSELSKVIRWEGRGAVHYRPAPEIRKFFFESETYPEEKLTIASLDRYTEYLASFAPGEVEAPAKCIVLRVVNGYLGRTAQPALLWDLKSRKVLQRYYPRSLLGAVYLQFAAAILSGRQSQVCPVCGRYFEVTALSSRNDRQTCSNRCRVRAYRERQARARALHGEGWSIKRIAKELGSENSTIKKWLSKDKE